MIFHGGGSSFYHLSPILFYKKSTLDGTLRLTVQAGRSFADDPETLPGPGSDYGTTDDEEEEDGEEEGGGRKRGMIAVLGVRSGGCGLRSSPTSAPGTARGAWGVFSRV